MANVVCSLLVYSVTISYLELVQSTRKDYSHLQQTSPFVRLIANGKSSHPIRFEHGSTWYQTRNPRPQHQRAGLMGALQCDGHYGWVCSWTAIPVSLALWHCGQKLHVWHHADPRSSTGRVTALAPRYRIEMPFCFPFTYLNS